MNLHEILKTAHIVAMTSWVGPLLALALVLPRLRDRPAIENLGALTPFLTAAMVITLALGLTLAAYAGWLSQWWVHAKLGLAFILAGVSGVVSGQLRRLSGDREYQLPSWMSYMPYVIMGLTVLAAAAAVSKP